MFTELNQPTGATLTLMADDTVAGPANDETDVVPSDIRDVPNLLAWSQDDDDLDEPRPSWRRACGLAGLIALSSLVIAVAVAAFGSNQGRQTASAPSSAPSSRTAPAPPPVTLPPIVPSAAPSTVTVSPLPSKAELDQRFLSAVSVAGLGIKNVDMTIRAGHDVCEALKDGHSKNEVEDAWVKANHTFTLQNAATLVDASVAVYCPQFAD